MRKQNIALLVLIIFTLIFIPACGGGGSSSGGGGGTENPPQPIAGVGLFNDGDLATYTKETWTFTITENTFISVNVFGARFDHEGWTLPTTNAPLIKLLDLSSTVGTPVSTHNVNNATWGFGLRDTEIPLYFLKKTTVGPTQTFSIEVTRQSPSQPGGLYKLRVNKLNSDIINQFGDYQTENELRGQDINSTIANAEDIIQVPTFKDALIVGHYEDGNPDFYQIHIDTLINPVIACFEIFAQRNGIWQSQLDYYDPEMTFYSPVDAPLNTVDDAFFFDSKACQKASAILTKDKKYKIEVSKPIISTSSSSSDYILKYTEELIANTKSEDEPNGTPVEATPIPDFGYLVDGSVTTTATDSTDWFSFSADAGDMISIRQFDFENTVETAISGTIKVEVFDSTGSTAIPFNGPAPGADGRFAALLEDLTTTFFIPTTAVYTIKITTDLGTGASTRPYSFIVDLNKQAAPESEPNNNLNGTDADLLLTIAGTGFGKITPSTDVDYFKLDPADIGITSGDHIVVHIYATRDADEKAFDTTGFGSTLEPKVTVYDDSIPTSITTSTYINDTSSNAASEGINEPYPTVTAMFKETGSTFYYFRVEGINSTTGLYLIEVVNLGQ